MATWAAALLIGLAFGFALTAVIMLYAIAGALDDIRTELRRKQ